jgi:methyl-accepting chemotaxis protein
MSIRKKIYFILSVTLIGLVLVISGVYYAILQLQEMDRKVETVTQTTELGEIILYTMLTNRGDELKYTKSKHQENAVKVKKNIEILQSNMLKLKELTQNELVRTKTDELYAYSGNYLDKFENLVKNNKEIDKISKSTAQASSSVLAAAQQAKELNILNETHVLRETETQFLFYANPMYIDIFNKKTTEIKELIAQSDELSEIEKKTLMVNLDWYQEHFKKLADLSLIQQDLMGEFSLVVEQMEIPLTEIDAQLHNEIVTIKENKTVLYQTLVGGLITLSALLLLMILVVGLWLSRSIVGSIRRLQKGAEVIGAGNLAYRVESTSRDEMESLAQTFNTMAEYVQQSLLEVQRVAEHLSSSSEELTNVSMDATAQSKEVNLAFEQVAIGAQNQSQSLEQGSHLLDKMKSELDQVNQNSEQISVQANLSSKKGKEGVHVVNELEQTSQEFIQLAKNLISNVELVTENSKHILGFVKTIEDIADNTDLLALNAAIESARAGEAGRGFSVVADEIRKLADKSKSEAKSIHNVVSAMGAKMEELFKGSKLLEGHGEKQSQSVIRTRDSFEEIVEQVDTITTFVKSTGHSLESVNASSEQLILSVHDTRAVSQESAATAEQVAASSENQRLSIERAHQTAIVLQDLAQKLIFEVNKFNIQEDAHQALRNTAGEQSEDDSEEQENEEQKSA